MKGHFPALLLAMLTVPSGVTRQSHGHIRRIRAAVVQVCVACVVRGSDLSAPPIKRYLVVGGGIHSRIYLGWSDCACLRCGQKRVKQVFRILGWNHLACGAGFYGKYSDNPIMAELVGTGTLAGRKENMCQTKLSKLIAFASKIGCECCKFLWCLFGGCGLMTRM
eukprot:4497748-Amphidinium_carterae.1